MIATEWRNYTEREFKARVRRRFQGLSTEFGIVEHCEVPNGDKTEHAIRLLVTAGRLVIPLAAIGATIDEALKRMESFVAMHVTE